jgi:hypothetical protein
MTHQTSRLTRTASVALVAALLLPSFALAQNDASPRRLDSARDRMEKNVGSSTPRGTGGQNFCANIDSAIAKINDAQRNGGDKRKMMSETRGAKRDEKRDTREDKLDDKRSTHGEDRSSRYTKMMEKATTTEQKVTVETFRTAVENAVSKRQAAVDAAIATYRTASDKLITDRKLAVETAGAAHKSAVDAAIAKAKTDCAGGVDAAAVRSTMRAEIKSANDTFKTASKRPEELSNQIKPLREARDAAIKKAVESFKTEFEAAKAVLKAALGR